MENYPELPELLEAALHHGDATALEDFLVRQSNLPGPRANLPLINAFARMIGGLVAQPEPPVDQIEALLDGWASLYLSAAPVNDPREILPACAVLSYGQVAVVRPEWWEDEVAKLHKAASSPRWRTREIVAMGLQEMLQADWQRAYGMLQRWVAEDDPLVLRAAVAAIAEPPLLTSAERGRQALSLQEQALNWLAALPPERRRGENVRVLRQGLGYTVSVAVAAAPEPGLELLKRIQASPDPDLQWVLKENLNKQRLKKLNVAERLAKS